MIAELGPPLASGNVAEVFAWGEGRVLKLYKPAPWAKRSAFREAANQAAVEAMGLPAPAVHGVVAHAGRFGVVMDRVAGSSFAERMLADATLVPGHLDALIALQRRLQQAAAPFFAGVKQRLASHIERASELDAGQKHRLIAGLRALPDGEQLCHFDFHPMNVLGPIDRPIVVDWPDACRGPPAADACRSHVLLEIHAAPLAADYLARYCRASGCAETAVLAWRPSMLAAKLIETPAEAPRVLSLLLALTW